MSTHHSISQDPCEAAIHSIIHIIRTNHWIRNFLFPPHSESVSEEISQLSHAVVHPCIALGDMSLQVLPYATNINEPFQKRLQVIYAPLFTVDHFVAGFLIMNRSETCKFMLHQSPRYIQRTIRDLRTVSFFGIYEHPFGLTELTVLQQLSPGCRHESTAMLDTKIFRSILDIPLSHSSTSNTSLSDTSRTSTYSSNPRQALKYALIHSFYIVEMRKCPYCSADTLLSCSCVIESTFKQRQSIFESEIENWRTFAGTYEGELSYRIYQQGKILQAAECQAIANVQFLLNQDLTRELTTWAMVDATRKKKVNILKLCMPKTHVVEKEPRGEVEKDALVKEFQHLYIMDTMRTCAQAFGVTKIADIPTRERCLQKLAPTPEGYTRIVISKPLQSNDSLSKEIARKCRNRESAQRSNERRSKQLKELKDGIRCMGEREKYLRGRLEQLRSENRAMKLKLSKKWASEI